MPKQPFSRRRDFNHLGCALSLSLSLVALATSSGCGSDSGPPPVDYFVPDHVLEIEITLDPADWDAARTETRTFFSTLFREDCLSEPFGSPFTYYDATVSVDGVVLEHVGVRKKGFLGSLDDDKPSLKLNFDEFVEGQLLFGTERMTLNNSVQDPSYLNQCLGYGVFADAGVPASRCNFAHVTVNGIDLGLYVHVEDLKKRFLRDHFDDDEGDLYEGTLSDFQEGWLATFEQKTNRDVVSDRAPLRAVSDSLTPGAAPEALDQLIDLDSFRSLWAVETLIGHWDGYAGNTNNYFVYRDPLDDRFRFLPWGIDQTFAESGGAFADEIPEVAIPAFTTGAIAHHQWTSPQGRSLYEARLREVLDTAFDETALLAEMDRMEALIRPYLQPRDMERGFDDAIAERRGFIAGRRERLLAGLASPYDAPPPRETICFSPVGDVAGTFATTHGSLGTEEPFTGANRGTITASLAETPVAFTAASSLAGFDEGNPTLTTVAIFGFRDDMLLDIVVLQMENELMQPGVTLDIDWAEVVGFVLVLDTTVMDAEPVVEAVLAGGSVTFTEGEAIDAVPVVGSFEAQLFPPFF